MTMLGQGKSAVATPGSTILNGQKTVAAAGTAEPLVATSTPIIFVVVKALHGNGNDVYVGNSGVSNANGFVLDAGEETPPLPVDDLAEVYVDVGANGEGVSYIAVAK